MADENAKDKGFTITDRRVTVESGEGPSEAKPETPPRKAPPAPGPGPAAPPPSSRPLPEITFPTFLVSLSTSALMHLGLIPNPANGQPEKDLPLAKQTIDLLSLLKQKTQGNLDPEETQLLDSVLYDLRMRYVEISKE